MDAFRSPFLFYPAMMTKLAAFFSLALVI